ncbi:hypothetical protein V6N13_042861 [Hibiscus sabdariffa]
MGMRNSIRGLEINGHWVTLPALLKRYVSQYFSLHFSQLQVDGSSEPVVRLARLDVDSRDNLELPFTVKEVWDAIHLGSGCKALGPDGYSLEFYKRGVATLLFVFCF